MSLGETMIELFAKDNAKIDRWHEQLIETNAAYKRSFVRLLSVELSKLQKTENGIYVMPSFMNDIKLAELEAQLPFMFEDAGMRRLLEDELKIYDKRFRSVDVVWNQSGLLDFKLGIDPVEIPEIAEYIRQTINAVDTGRQAAQADMIKTIGEYRNTIQRSEQISFNELTNKLISNSGVLPKYAGTVATTNLTAIDRTIRKAQGKKGGVITARYSGVLDSITRAFCARNVGKVETWDYWDSIQNDVSPNPPSIYGGGFNCRHQIFPYSEEWD